MAQILDPLPSNQRNQLLCCYVNATNQIQIVRITNIINWYFERVVFPGQRLVFEALSDSLLEIHTGMMASAILSDTIPCEYLAIGESDSEGKLDDDEVPAQEKQPAPVGTSKQEKGLKESLSVLNFNSALASAH